MVVLRELFGTKKMEYALTDAWSPYSVVGQPRTIARTSSLQGCTIRLKRRVHSME